MQAYFVLVRRELGAQFVSLTGYVVIAAVVFLIGLTFVGMLQALNTVPISSPITEMFFDTFSFWLILLVSVPIITMRSFAQEKHSGTFETLMTTSVSDLQVVLAKFSGAFVFYGLMWLPVVALVFILRHYTRESMALDLGSLGVTFLGVLLLGMLFISLGCLTSSITRSQMMAAMLCFVAGISLFLMSFLSYALPPQAGWSSVALNHVNLVEHMRDFSRGILDTRQVLFYVSTTCFFLFLTLKVVESRRWR
jgi:ABC-2 type transport system permease protein